MSHSPRLRPGAPPRASQRRHRPRNPPVAPAAVLREGDRVCWGFSTGSVTSLAPDGHVEIAGDDGRRWRLPAAELRRLLRS